MQEAVDFAVQLKYDRIREESNTENQQFLDSIDEGMKKVIKEQVKKEVSKITPKIENLVNEQLESEVLIRSSKEAKTSHAVAANLSELELKKILIDKMEANNSINRSDIQRQLYKALVDAYEADKILLNNLVFGHNKKTRDAWADDDQNLRWNRPGVLKKSQSATGKGNYESADVFETPAQPGVQTFELEERHVQSLTELVIIFEEDLQAKNRKKNGLDQPLKDANILMDLRQHYCFFQILKASCLPFHHFINNDLEYLRGGESSRKYSTSVTKTTAADYGYIKWIEDLVPNSMWSQMIVKYDKFTLWGISYWGKKRRQFYAFATSRESARDVYSKRRIIAVTKGKLTTYRNVEERIAFNVSLRIFTRSVVIQRRVEDLQLGVESYQKKLNLTKPDTYRSNLRRRDAYTPYSDPRGFIYENKDKKNRLMRIDELHKFSDGTLDDVRTALNDRLKGIRMEYLPQTFLSQRGKVRNGKGINADCDGAKNTGTNQQGVSYEVSVLSDIEEILHAFCLSTFHFRVSDIEKVAVAPAFAITQRSKVHLLSLSQKEYPINLIRTLAIS
ncbi:hypothetical protein Tco_1438099 [Tanacetum coccineum]